MTGIQINSVSKEYKSKKVLESINLNIDSGAYGLLGNNGAGKTTLLNIIATLLPATKGCISINDILISAKNIIQLRKNIGYIPQESNMYPNLTVGEVLEYFGLLNGVENCTYRCDELLEFINLKDEKNTKYKNLSGGMKRRLSLAIALINNPNILLTDEPTTGVDPIERMRMRNLLLELSKTKTILLSTHILEDITHICDKLAYLKKGNIIYDGDTKEMIQQVSGKVWLYDGLDKEVHDTIASSYMLLNKSITTQNNVVKFYSKQKIQLKGVIPVEPTFEDAYIIIGEEN